MTAFFVFLTVAAAEILDPVPALAGIFLGVVGGLGRLKAAFALGGPALVALGLAAYLRDPYGQLADNAYFVGVQFLAMLGWSLFVGALTMTIREGMPVKIRPVV